MKTYHLIISLAGVVFLTVIDFFCGGKDFCFSNVAANLLFVDAFLIGFPFDHEKESNYQVFALAFLAVCSLISLFAIRRLIPLIIMAASIVNLYLRLRRKFSKVRNLFKSDEVWNNVLDYHDLFTACLLSIPALLVAYGTAASVVSIVLQGVVITAVFKLKTDGLSFLLNAKNKRIIRSIANSNLRDPHDCDASAESRRMNALYRSAMEYMEKHQPYLDENFNLEEFSRKLYTNKVYLSRTVNTLSGRNFRQFVNYYRIKYSTELFRQDPRLKVEELAMMSGFHTAVSFNMAFHMFMNETPSEWMRRYRGTLI